MATYDIETAIKSQEQYCIKNKYPHFAPDDGICWDCCQNIYADKGRTRSGKETHGISVEGAGNHLITGCPFCSRSYCD